MGAVISISVAIGVAILGSFLAIFLALFFAERGAATQEKARARRMAEHKMNARLLKFNL